MEDAISTKQDTAAGQQLARGSGARAARAFGPKHRAICTGLRGQVLCPTLSGGGGGERVARTGAFGGGGCGGERAARAF